MLTDKSFRDLMSAFASPAPTPGGGSAAAAASAMGVSLLLMVASLPKTRSKSAEDRAALDRAVEVLGALQRDLIESVDADSAAYDAVVAAYKEAKAGTLEDGGRAAIQLALHGATEVPLRVMRLSLRALQQAETVAVHGHRSAASDVGVAIALVGAGLSGARLNVDVNLEQLTDAGFRAAAAAEAEQMAGDGSRLTATAQSLLPRW